MDKIHHIHDNLIIAAAHAHGYRLTDEQIARFKANIDINPFDFEHKELTECLEILMKYFIRDEKRNHRHIISSDEP